jgi:serine/threonine-protein kinase
MIGRIFLRRYQALRQLGEGGMGRVYLGRQLDLGRQVVIKVMHDHIAADPVFRQRFERETLLMAHFQHPYAVTLYDASLDDPEGSCIVMEYIRGVTLDVLLEQNKRLSPQRAGRLLGQLCEVLHAAHGQGIIHRDLKPSNLMVVDADTPYEKIKVMDFGLATLLDTNSLKKAKNTNAEFAVGTPAYICPEQVRGDEVDHRADLYSVGMILYQLLTGKLPFAGRASMDTMLAHAMEEPPSFAEVGAGNWLWPALEKVVRSCLAKNPADRPSTARDLAQAYQDALEQEGVEPEETPPSAVSEAGSVEEPAAPEPVIDPNAVVHILEAWMPEQIASHKLRGFVHASGGDVVESVPGRIRVLLGGKGSVYAPADAGPLAWFGLSRKGGLIEMELRLEQAVMGRENVLHITVIMRPVQPDADDREWRERSEQIYCDLRSYLMGQTRSITGEVG